MGGGRRVIFDQIEAERERHQHDTLDDIRPRAAWAAMLKDHVSRSIRAGNNGDDDEWRHRMLVIAALCIAAIEAHDRRSTGKMERIELEGGFGATDDNEPTDPTIMPLPTDKKPKDPDPA